MTDVVTSGYRRRVVDDEIDQLTRALAAVAIEGPKAVGKTSTALRRAATVVALDDPGQRQIAQADLDRILDGPPPVLIDEWQLVPAIWDRVRRAVDAGAAPASFLLTGSASPSLSGSHSGGGRIVSVRLRPLSLGERLGEGGTVSLAGLLAGDRPEIAGRTPVRLADYADEVVRSGFPGIRDLSERALRAQLDGYLARIVDRDFPELGQAVRRPDALRRWMAAYAAATSTTTTWEKIRDAASAGHRHAPARTTTLPYRDVLERLFILDAVPGWQPARNPISALTLPPKHHLADPALAARLLGATTATLLRGDPRGPVSPRNGTLLGALFESLVTLSVRVYAQAAESRVFHLRTRAGDREVDLIVERADGRVVAFEVKLAAVPDDRDLRHLLWLRERIGDDLLDAAVITTGREAYRRPDGIAVIPAALLGP